MPSLPANWRERRSPAPASCCDSSDLTPAELREKVTSPKGTTAAALEVLMGKGGFERAAHHAPSPPPPSARASYRLDSAYPTTPLHLPFCNAFRAFAAASCEA